MSWGLGGVSAGAHHRPLGGGIWCRFAARDYPAGAASRGTAETPPTPASNVTEGDRNG